MRRFTLLFSIMALLSLPGISHGTAGEEEWVKFGEAEAVNNITIDTITSSSTTATATAAAGHQITALTDVVISGCTGAHAAKYCITTDIVRSSATVFTYTIVDAGDVSATCAVACKVNRTSTPNTGISPGQVFTATFDEVSDYSAVLHRKPECLNLAYIQSAAMANSLDTCYTNTAASCVNVEQVLTSLALDHINIKDKPWDYTRVQNEASGTGLIHAKCFGNGK